MSDDGTDRSTAPRGDEQSTSAIDDAPVSRSRRNRWRGLLGVGAGRTWTKATATQPRRTLATVAGVALAVALMVIVVGIALGLSSQTTVAGDSIDYWIAPESGSAESMVVDTSGPRFGDTHAAASDLAADERIRHATPVLVDVLDVSAETSSGSTSEYVLAVGVVAADSVSVGGVTTSALTPGDPHYGNGSYDGDWTGEAVISSAGASILGAGDGTTLRPRTAGNSNRTFSVIGVDSGEGSGGLGNLPVMVVHLSELQAMTGAAEGDQADQILVETNDRGVRERLESVYPRSTVLTRGGLTARNVTSGLPLALSLAALVVAIVVGTLFVATTMGLEVTANRDRYAVLGALGLSSRSSSLLVVVQTLVVTLLGGFVGVVVGYGGIVLTNVVGREVLLSTRIALPHPALAISGVLVAIVIALLSVPYLLWQTNRTSAREQLGG